MAKKNGLTKKEIRRFKKSTLLQMLGDKGSKKMSKNSLVDAFFRDKNLRSTTVAKEKRKLTEKQKANLSKWRIGKDFKNEQIIKQPAQFAAEIRKIEDTETIGRGQPNEFKDQKKIGEGKGRFRETQVERLKQQANTNKAAELTRAKELKDSTNKTSDLFDTTLERAIVEPSKIRSRAAIHHAKSSKDVRFGEGESANISAPAGDESINSLMGLPATQLMARLKLLKEQDPNSPVLIIIQSLLAEKKKRQS